MTNIGVKKREAAATLFDPKALHCSDDTNPSPKGWATSGLPQTPAPSLLVTIEEGPQIPLELSCAKAIANDGHGPQQQYNQALEAPSDAWRVMVHDPSFQTRPP
jgi:hypothetical protein